MLLPSERQRSLFDARVVGAYAAGASSGALVSAVVAWFLSGLFEPVPVTARAALLILGSAAIWLVKDGPLSGARRLPEARRQIPAEVFGGNLVRAAYRFGFELGTGVRTFVTSPAPYVLLLVVLLARPTLLGAIAIGFGFGIGRAMPLVALLLGGARRLSAGQMRRRTHGASLPWTWWLVLAGGLSLV